MIIDYSYIFADWLSHCSAQPVVIDDIKEEDHWLQVSMLMKDDFHLCWFQWEQYQYIRWSSQRQVISSSKKMCDLF